MILAKKLFPSWYDKKKIIKKGIRRKKKLLHQHLNFLEILRFFKKSYSKRIG